MKKPFSYNIKNLIKKYFLRSFLLSAVLTVLGYTGGWFRNSAAHPFWLPLLACFIICFLIFLIVNILADIMKQTKRKK